MAKGQIYNSEKIVIQDGNAKSSLVRLTDKPGWHILPYFTNSAFTQDSRSIVFESDRYGKCDVFSIEIESGEIKALTDVPADIPAPSLRYYEKYGYETGYRKVICDLVSVVDRRVFYRAGNEYRCVDMDTLEDELLWNIPESIIEARPHMSSDGKYLIFPAMDAELFNFPLPDEEKPRLQHHVWKRVKSDPKLMSYLFKLDIGKRKVEELTRENNWITHAQFSPMNSNRVLYCHEGVWEDVHDRMWLLDSGTGEKLNLRKQTPDICIGHEMWISGSERILYHGWAGNDTLIGFINADNTDMVEYRSAGRFYGHFCPNADGSVLVTDAGIYRDMISLITFEEDTCRFHPVCHHNNIWKHHIDHPHPQFSPDGKYILFSSSQEPGNSSIYLVEVPEEFRRSNQPEV